MSKISDRIARERPDASELAAKVSAFAETHRDLDDVAAAEPGALTGTAEQIEDARAVIAESAREARERVTAKDLAMAVRESVLTLEEAQRLERAHRSYERGSERERR